MSKIWDALIDLKEHYIENFERLATEYEEPGMGEFNHADGGWVNRTWRSNDFRRAHVDVVDARESHKLWMMHVCIFPHVNNSGPIYGFDVIAGPNKMTGAFHDFSSTTDIDHPLIRWFSDRTAELKWNRERELPDWAKEIFSDGMMAAGMVKEESEINQVVDFAKRSLRVYTDRIGSTNGEAQIEFGTATQNRYAHFQKQNPHTPRVMKSLGLDPDAVDKFQEKCLFPELQ
jgi:hypothetical protein